jgi:hypothetical protein
MLNKVSLMSRFKTGGGEAKLHHSGLSNDIAAALREQFSSLAGQDLSGYTGTQERSRQSGAKFDLHIYDASGELRYEGRKFDGAQGVSFWKPGAQ